MTKARKKTGPPIGPEGKAKPIGVSVPTGLVEELDAYCQANDVGRSAVATEAIREYLKRASKRAK